MLQIDLNPCLCRCREPVGQALGWLLALLFAAGAPPIACAQGSVTAVELSEFFRGTAVAPGVVTGLPWNQLDGSGVRWNTAAPVATPPPHIGGAQWRIGSVVLHQSGKPLARQSDGKPLRWRVQATGSRDGVASLWLTASPTDGGNGPDFAALSSGGFRVNIQCENTLGAGMAIKAYLLTLPAKAPLTVRFESSSDRSGSSLDIRSAYIVQSVAQTACN